MVEEKHFETASHLRKNLAKDKDPATTNVKEQCSSNQNNLLSLMAEMTLTDTPWNIQTASIDSDVSSCNPDVDECKQKRKTKLPEGCKYCIFDYQNEMTCQMHAEIANIKKAFQVST